MWQLISATPNGWLDELHTCAVKDANEGIVVQQLKIPFCVDLNGTRVAAQHGLIESALRLKLNLKVFAA